MPPFLPTVDGALLIAGCLGAVVVALVAGYLAPVFFSSSFLPFSTGLPPPSSFLAFSMTFSATLIPSFLASAGVMTEVSPPAFSLSLSD